MQRRLQRNGRRLLGSLELRCCSRDPNTRYLPKKRGGGGSASGVEHNLILNHTERISMKVENEIIWWHGMLRDFGGCYGSPGGGEKSSFCLASLGFAFRDGKKQSESEARQAKEV